MKIGIVGLGVVGSAINSAFASTGHTVIGIDRTNTTKYKFADLIETDCVFICVDTPTINNQCDTTNVRDCVQQLADIKYDNTIIIKSTVSPGTTQNLIDQHSELKICFIPEFLHQHQALHDFMHSQTSCIVGTHSAEVFEFVKNLHREFNPDCVCLTPTEAEITKYFVNNFNALRIVFANIYYELCTHYHADYQKVLAAAVTRPAVGNDSYLHCNETLRGFSGACLPKDLEAMTSTLQNLGISADLFGAILHDNQHYNKK